MSDQQTENHGRMLEIIRGEGIAFPDNAMARLCRRMYEEGVNASRMRIAELEHTLKSHGIPVKTFAGGEAHFATAESNEPPLHSPRTVKAKYKAGTVKDGDMGWRPIETAPKDKRVLVWSGQELYAARWAKNPYTNDEAWIVAEWGEDGDQALVRPTHWMPLPEPPNVCLVDGQQKE